MNERRTGTDRYPFKIILAEHQPSYEMETPFRRVETDLPFDMQVHEGQWYSQGLAPTCLPWAVANAVRAIRIDLPKSFAEILHSTAVGKREGAHMLSGMSWTNITSNYTINAAIPRKKQLTPTTEDARKVRRNAQILYDTLSIGKTAVILLSENNLEQEVTDKDEQKVLHAVAAVGYRVSPEGFLDVQIVNSNGGRSALVPIENISASVTKPLPFISPNLMTIENA